MTGERYLVPYYRVSTDDKGQDPERQAASCLPWAQRENFHVLKPVLDVGTSASKIPALARPLFVEACERAAAAGAEAILMELPDRFSRMDPDIAIWEKVEAERRYKVKLYFACMSLEMQSTPIGKCFLFMSAASAHQWAEDHRERTLTGMARKRAAGTKFGRKRKPVSVEEEQFIDELRREAPGKAQTGWEKIAVLVNERRGVHLLTDRKLAYERSISASALKRWDRERQAESGRNETGKLPVESPPAVMSESDGQAGADSG